jgi:2-dehydropantoate 2-reductase
VDDILLLTVKSQDAAGALAFWSWRPVVDTTETAAEILPIVTFQNGLASEAAALRTFVHAYGASILTSARFTETGKVVVGGDPQVGIVSIGRFPTGSDATQQPDCGGSLPQRLSRRTKRRYPSLEIGQASPQCPQRARTVRRAGDLRREIGEALVDEARRTLQAAGYRLALPSERTIDISSWRTAQDSGIHPGQQSTWQSFDRGASSEVDFLNGEIVLLGRLHGQATPYNDAVQVLAGRLSQRNGLPATLSLDAILSLVDNSKIERQTGLAAVQ